MRLFKVYWVMIIILFNVIIDSSFAWGKLGHEVVAAIAYDQLTSNAKRRLRYYNHALKPVYGDLPILQAAAWPDWFRSHDIVVFSTWHYIDIPFIDDNQKAPQLDKQNVVWAIEQSKVVLTSKHANAFEKGLFLRFLMHNMGDIHQPMHCITHVSSQFPNGDRGGNDEWLGKSKKQNLHQYWDSGAGLFKKNLPTHASNHDIFLFARKLTKAYPRERLPEAGVVDSQRIAEESFHVAKDIAYQKRLADGMTRSYQQEVQTVIEKRLVLAGYRLGTILNQILN